MASSECRGESTTRMRKRPRTFFCGHCNKEVSKATFYRHRTDVYKQEWQGTGETGGESISATTVDGLDISDDEPVISESAEIDQCLPEASLSEISSDDSEPDDEDGLCLSSVVVNNEELCSDLSDESDSDNDVVLNVSKTRSLSALALKLLWFLFFWQSVFNISERAVQCIIRFIKYLLNVLSTNGEELKKLSEEIPVTTKSVMKLLSLDNPGIINYVVCPKCNSIYEYEDCYTTLRNGNKESKLCKHICYPSHPHSSKRTPCNTLLMKTVKSNKKECLVPFVTYSYHPVHLSLRRMALQPGFLSSCEKWRHRESLIPFDHFGDIYDGSVWKSFRSDFLSAPYSYLLTMNVDWFQPYKHVQYSVGVIYLTIQNLPREERFKQKNVLLVGIIPGPKEPKMSIDPYLLPLIEELNNSFSNGIIVQSPCGTTVTIRLALSCVSCDIPATRKVCGFLGHNARLGCNKCYKEFSVSSRPYDFSGYDRNSWELRTAEKHRADCLKVQSCVTKTSICEIESQLGVRPSALLRLAYYDPIKFVAIDAMHNLFLGTSKRMFLYWVESGIISNDNLKFIDQVASSFVVPNNMGRLPLSISSNHASFTAAQWLTWTTIYSPVVLKGVLPDTHLRCWLLFVKACTILTQRTIRLSDIDTADNMLLVFCKKIEELYGFQCCSPNMHLHLHLKETLLSFGPVHTTWCFSFERYNGILGAVPTNNKSIEVQFMQKFLQNQIIQSHSAFLEDEDIKKLLPNASNESSDRSLSHFVVDDVDLLALINISYGPLDLHPSCFKDSAVIKTVGRSQELVFTSHEMSDWQVLYEQLNPECTIEYMSPFYNRYGRIGIGCDILGSTRNCHSAQSSSFVAAYWPSTGSNVTHFDCSKASIGKVQYFFTHSITIQNVNSSISQVVHYTIAYVHWMDYHHENSLYGSSATVCANSVKEVSVCSYLPVLRIYAKCATCRITLHDVVLVACPIPLKLSM